MNDSSPTGGRLVGAIQIIGGGLEIALGVGGVAAPTGVSQVCGVILIAHGGDTVIAGFRSLYYGEAQSTFTQQGATAAAAGLGASPQTAHYVGAGVDFAAGVGPGVAVGVSRRLAIAGAEAGSERVAMAYMNKSAFRIGHNAVGIRQGGTTAWVHFSGLPTGAVRAMEAAPDARYVITEMVVTAEQARNASAASRVLMAEGMQTWGYLGPNCTTTTLRILREAGIVVPAWSRTPFLLHLGVRYGGEITVVGGAAAAGFGIPYRPARPGAAGPLSPNAQRLLAALPATGAMPRTQLTVATGLLGAPFYEAIQELEKAGKITVTRFGADELNILTVARR